MGVNCYLCLNPWLVTFNLKGINEIIILVKTRRINLNQKPNGGHVKFQNGEFESRRPFK